MVQLIACLGLVLTLACNLVQASSHEVVPFTLLARSSTMPLSPQLTEQQQHWLQGRQALILGTSAPDYPPFDITSGGQIYQGLTAEYASLISKALNLPIQVMRYPHRQAALQALKRGEIDLLGSANGYEAATEGLTLSHPYAVDQPVLVTREDEPRALSGGLNGMRLGMLYHYLPQEVVHAAYPKAEVLVFGSSTQALNAVAFGQADVFFGDTISTHYQLNRGHLPRLRIASFGQHENFGFSFAMRAEDEQLKELVNATLDRQSGAVRTSILKRWSAGSELLLSDRQLQLTPEEEHWLLSHPVMQVAIDETASPLSYFDGNGHFRGITADLLDLIRLRTGLRFEVQRANGIADMLARLESGRVSMIAALASDGSTDKRLHLSRPYLESPHVLVTRAQDEQYGSLEKLNGRRVAISRYSNLDDLLTTRFPQIGWIDTESPFYSVALLNSGAVDAVITPLIDANHALASNTNLIIRSTVGSEPAIFSMATRDQDMPLASILDKALLSISPEELGVINNRWRGYDLHEDASWSTLRRLILKVLLGTGVLLLLALIWNARLRGQIKQRQRAERALNDQLEFMGALLNGTPHPMYVRDREGRLQSCNASYLEAVQSGLEEVIGRRLDESLFAGAENIRQIQADYQQVMAAGVPLIIDRPLRLRDREITIYHWILPYRDSLGEVQGIIGGWIDISERRKLVQELREAKRLADDANRAKSTFLATISHEIRTPMNAVIGMLELALRRALQGQADPASLEVAHHSARDLLGLIGDILDIVRIESGHLSLSPEAVDPAVLVESVGRVFDGQARQKGLALDISISPSARCHGLLDPLRFKQVLSNLVSNAIKFTEQGQVHVTLHLREEGPGSPPTLELEVRDSGIGIHDDDLQRLFNPFVQANPHSPGARAGTGLGLAICRSLCEMMGGNLSIKSLPGLGTQVRLLMPLERVDAPACPAFEVEEVEAPAPGLKVLVIDDHPANLLLMAQQLSYLGLSHASASNGREGLDKWRNVPFDVLVLDCNMPHMNGYQLATTVRSEERQSGRPRCVILGYTANAQPEVRQKCLSAGMDDCLLKPISLRTLSQRLAKIAPHRRQAIAPLFNLAGLAGIVGNNASSRARFLTAVHTSLQEDLAMLMDLDPHHQAAEIREQAHKILSAARLLEAKGMMKACKALEEERSSAACIKLQRQVLARHMRRVEKALARELTSA
ncbi:hybrid sensor histidine kinase/response regulator [Pseudomonas putida]|jgi:two-component system sensor histidine kinase EvgS|uniref:histidine kinase n=1 Tax=Pseudomonas putida TaxID=303 RepID=A0A2S3WYF4_PSEPU|nr:transporter substrate-binding domain-containing protein [Pseudomonas putida]POG06422.1 hybrid sensor histidine kinase/response regulator [Pseudomonas putida]POG09164.1 hybrid sensor histidine kinase/response regulator [Pseudomonas putida]